MKTKILLTRPRTPSESWAAMLLQHGFETDIEPLLTIVPTGAPRPAESYQAVMITSASAIEVLRGKTGEIGDLLALPCFCVGNATGEAARLLGFKNVSRGASDGAALAQAIVAALGGNPLRLLHIGGDLVDPKAQDILTRAGLTVGFWQVYRADETEDFSDAIRDAFAASAYLAVPVFSPRTARILVSIVEKNRMTQACHAMTAIALSQPIADVLQTLPWQRLRVAASPAEEDVLECLQMERTAQAKEPEATVPLAAEPLLPATPRRRRTRWIWGALAVLVLTGAGTVALRQLPAINGLAEQETSTTDKEAELEQRMRTVEARLESQPESATEAAPVAAPAASVNDAADIAALKAQIQTLQTEIGQLQTQTQKYIAAAFAFWDLREEARTGQPFAAPLADLKTAAPHDTVIASQGARLEPFAAAGVATLPQLRDLLASAELTVPMTASAADTSSWWARIKSILQNLISVRPLHDPQFAALEQALDSGDTQSAIAAFDALPSTTQASLAPWRQKLEARVTTDTALRALAAHFAAPPEQDQTP